MNGRAIHLRGVSSIADLFDRSAVASGHPRPVFPGSADVPGGGVASGQQAIEQLIADLALRFVTLEPELIDDAILGGLRDLGEALQVDCVILWRTAVGEAGAVASHSWIRHSQSPGPDPPQLSCSPFIASALAAPEATWFTRLEEVPDPVAREALQAHGLRSVAAVPVPLADSGRRGRAALVFGSTDAEHSWMPATIEHLRLVAGVIGQALARKTSHQAVQRALEDLQQLRKRLTDEQVEGGPNNVQPFQASRLRDRLQAENVYLRHEAQVRCGTGAIVGQSAAIHRALELARQVAATDSTVLLLGETGTGKGLIATHIHELSARRGRLMVRVNCSAIPTTLIESELFGREKGAFTGALARQVGRFELADRSTVFLDEIGDLPADVQVKLLRVLEERQIERLGSPKAIPVNVRIIAATHRNLETRIAEDAFREDLFYRLNVFPIQVPSLRDRAEDIPLLVWRFVDEFSKSFGKRIDTIPKENMAALQRYPWPGNIRELRNVVERAMIVATDTELRIARPRSSIPPGRSTRMADVEKEHVRSVLESTGWRIRGSNGAADRLGLRPTTLETRMARLGLTRPKP
jgi:transcriptional regulator with GAF, ATPase, and Fis domain